MLAYEDQYVKLFNDDCRNLHIESEIIFTDPSFDLCFTEYADVLLSAKNHSFVYGNERNLVMLAYENIKFFSKFFVVDTVQPHLVSSIAPMTQADFIAEFRFNKTSFVNNHEAFSTILRSIKRRNVRYAYKNFRKNEVVPATFIKHYTKEGDVVYDPFAGSCSTLVAAKKLKRKAIGVEIDAKICNMFIDTMRQSEMFE